MPISSASPSLVSHTGFTPGEYYFAGNILGAASSTSTGASTIRYQPIIISEDITIDRLAVDVATAVASAQAKLGVFRPSLTTKGKPGSLLIATGFLDCSTTGVKAGVIADTLLNAGAYYFASLGGSTSPTLRVCNNTIYSNFVGDSGGTFTDFWAGYTQTGVSDFPSQAPSSLGTNRIIPLIKFRVKP